MEAYRLIKEKYEEFEELKAVWHKLQKERNAIEQYTAEEQYILRMAQYEAIQLKAECERQS